MRPTVLPAIARVANDGPAGWRIPAATAGMGGEVKLDDEITPRQFRPRRR
jgi:hypothetical protein